MEGTVGYFLWKNRRIVKKKIVGALFDSDLEFLSEIFKKKKMKR